MDFISGIVERITYQNEENGYSVLKIRSKGHPELVTIVGNLGAVHVGSVLKLHGSWKVDSKFGRQFGVVEFEETLPATAAGMEKYLGSGLIKGVGPVYAKRIVEHFKDRTLAILEEEPDRLIEVGGIGEKRVETIKVAWREQKEIKNVMIFLQSHGISTSYSVKIYKTYGDKSVELVRENPYRLADDIWGIGFKTADAIAAKMGIHGESYARVRSGILYTLNRMSEEGHCFYPREALIEEAHQILSVEPERVKVVLAELIEKKDVIVEMQEEGVYIPPLYFCEIGVAGRIRHMQGDPLQASADVEGILEKVQQENGFRYDPIQIEAVKKAADAKFMVLTGGPGTGKTTTTLAIIKVFAAMGMKVLLAAPTGRAAKRMAEATGMEAKTIHRLLEYKPGEGYKKNEEAPLDCEVLIVDEASMIDIVLMHNLLKAVPKEGRMLMVGDVDQLPSVGPGNVLKDIIDAGNIPVIQLTTIFRQAADSKIIVNAHRINKGEMPQLKNDKTSDFFHMEEEEPSKILETIRDLCTKRLPTYYGVHPMEDIQVLCPMQRGELGARNVNEMLQNALNPDGDAVKYGGVLYRRGDKVMQIKNNYDKSVFNGDIGRITAIDFEDKSVLVSFDGNDVEYDVSELDELVLAYATTVHKSQGSEYKVVVAPVSMQHYMMLQRNLLYTCVTRAKKILVLVGTKKAVAMAIHNNKTMKRHTLLAARINGGIQEKELLQDVQTV